jgi:nitronate monooxygenase
VSAHSSTRVYDIVRQRNWPLKYDLRPLANPLIEAWDGNESGLRARLPEAMSAFQKAEAEQDFGVVTPIVGEAISLVRDVRPRPTSSWTWSATPPGS